MEGEGSEDESLEKSHQQDHLLLEVGVKPSRNNVRTNIPLQRPSRQLWLHAALMCGRDFLYAVEVVLVTPIMLQLGMPEYLYSYIWFISPSFGLLLGPFMGNWSDKCTLKWGRRRPFILSFVVGTVISLTLMIFSKDLALLLSNSHDEQRILGIVFGVLGTQVMDFCLDQLEAPLRAFTLDVCSPADQQRAFMLQTLAMGMGAALGFIIDGIKWENIISAEMQGLQIKVVYAFAILIYISTALMTLFSIKESPWVNPTKKAFKGNSTLTGNRRIETREVFSEPAISKSKKRGLLKCNKICEENATTVKKTNCAVPSVIVTSDLANHDSTDKIVDSSSSSGAIEKVPLNCCATTDVNPKAAASMAFRTITVFPRISLCKSVFMTMSCPEGLNDAVTSESNITSDSTATDNDESSDGDSATESTGASPDDDLFGRSLPNLSQKRGSPSTFLQLLKKVFSSSTGNLQSENSNAVPGGSTVHNHEELKPINTRSTSMDIEDENSIHYSTENGQMIGFSPKIGTNLRQNLQNLELSKNHDEGQNFPENTENSKNETSKDIENAEFVSDSQLKQSELNESRQILKTGDLNSNVVRKLQLCDSTPNGVPVSRKVSKKRKEKATDNNQIDEGRVKPVSTRLLWLSIVTMPMKLRFLCFSLLTSFMGIEVLMLWYTNIFGRVVYGGDPAAPENSTELQLYNDGVHMGCWGLTIHAVTMMLFSVAMEHFDILNKVSLRILYAGGQLLTAFSTAVMFFFPNEIVILSLSWTIGIMISTALTIPYVLVGKYHQEKEFVMKSPGATRRGFGTDCAILACQMYAGNLMYAAISGPAISSYGGVKIMLVVASLSHTVAFVVCAWFVTYPGERNYKFCSGESRTNVIDRTL